MSSRSNPKITVIAVGLGIVGVFLLVIGALVSGNGHDWIIALIGAAILIMILVGMFRNHNLR